MPEISGLLLLILFFGFSIIRKKVKQSGSKTQSPTKPQSYQPNAMPAFPEAALTLPVQPMAVEKARSVAKKAIPEPLRIPMEGEALDWKQEQRDPPLPKTAFTRKPSSKVIPVLTKNSLIQGIVLYEILTKPKHAVGSRLTDFPPRN